MPAPRNAAAPAPPVMGGAPTAGRPGPARRLAAPTTRRRAPARRLRGAGAVRAVASSFEELRSTASEAVAAAQSKLPLLEQAKNTAERAREPAADAERVWQDAHARLTRLQQEAASTMQSLRQDVTDAAGGESGATHALLEGHVAERLDHYRANHGLAAASEWRVYAPRDLPLFSIPGGRMMYQLAAAELDDAKYAVVSIAIANPFLFDNLRSLLLHWGCTEGAHAGWAQPPKGWHTSPGVSTPAGSLAWETVFGSFAPVLQGEPVVDAAVYSVVLQVPLEGTLELRGGIKCVLKRTDGGQPEWIKAGEHNHGDFFLDFTPVTNFFERKRRAAAAAALEAARRAALARGDLWPEDEEEEEEASATASVDASGSFDDGDVPLRRSRSRSRGRRPPPRRRKKDELPPLPEEEAPYAPRLPAWVGRVEQFVQLSDLPQERSLASHLKCLNGLATAIAEADGPGAMEARVLLQRCREAEGLLHQHDLADLSSRAAQQEKEQLQAIYRSASDESAHLVAELTAAAESARRTAVKLRGRESEITQRDLEAVSQQAAEELLKRNIKGVWPFKEERQLVFVQQKVMELAGLDAAVVVQVYVEGSKEAVRAATAESAAASGAAPPPDAPAVLAAAAEAAEAVAGKLGRSEPKPAPTFDHVVVGIAVAEEFPDGRLATPIIMHMGLVAHQHAKWQPPPEKWQCVPESVGLSASGSAAQVPFQRFTMRAEDGTPVFVDPTLFALALRLPLRDCLERGIRGVEFVLKTSDGKWRPWRQGGSNFYAELPLPLP